MISIGPCGLVRHYIKSLNLICVVRIDTKKKSTQEDSLHKREKKKEEDKLCLGFSRHVWRGQTDPHRTDILWDALKVHRRDWFSTVGSSIVWVLVKLIIKVLQ